MNLNFLSRDFKHTEIKLLFITMILSVFCVSSAIILTQGIQSGLSDTTGSWLGGDRILKSPNPIEPEIKEKAKALHLQTTETLTFLSMLVHHDDLALAEVKAVDEQYPLKGELRGTSQLFTADKPLLTVPEPGSVWLEASLFSLLNVKINDTILIGVAPFKITEVMTFESDRGGEGFMLAPRALINQKDIAKTAVIQPGSRLSYALLIAGPDQNLKEFDAWVLPKITPTESFLNAKEARPTLKTLLDQGENYLTLIVVINLILAGVAISAAAKRFAARQFNTVAIYRCFGASAQWIFIRYTVEIIILGLIAGVIGFLLGFFVVYWCQDLFEKLLMQKIEITLIIPAIFAILTVLVLTFGFAFPPLYALRKISPMRILRRDLSVKGKSNKGLLLRSLNLLLNILISSLGNLLGKFSSKLNVSVRYGLANIARYPYENSIQLLAFSLVFMAACLLFLVRTDLIQTWHNKIPQFAPNYFVINVGPEEKDHFQTFLHQNAIETQELYPIIRGRLLAVNNEIVELSETVNNTNNNGNSSNSSNSGNNGKRQLHRLLNLTYGLNLQKDNKIIAGSWLSTQDTGKSVISIEKGFSERQNIHMGDILKFQIGEKLIEATVTSIRTVEWDSFNPNFFVIFPPKVIDVFPTSYMTSFYVAPDKVPLLRTLIKQFPAINLIDISQILKLVAVLINLLSTVIEILCGFTAIMAFILLWCTIVSNLDERTRNAVLFRAIGVGNKSLLFILLSEFLLLGFVSGLIAALGASAIYAWLAINIFTLNFIPNWLLLIFGPLFSMILVGGGGWLGIRKVFILPPIQIFSRI